MTSCGKVSFQLMMVHNGSKMSINVQCSSFLTIHESSKLKASQGAPRSMLYVVATKTDAHTGRMIKTTRTVQVKSSRFIMSLILIKSSISSTFSRSRNRSHFKFSSLCYLAQAQQAKEGQVHTLKAESISTL